MDESPTPPKSDNIHVQGDSGSINPTGVSNSSTSKYTNVLKRKANRENVAIFNDYRRDIEELKSKYNKLKEFISIAAHELRTPITPILGTLELIEYEFEESGKDVICLRKEIYERILRNANRMERLASEILDVTKISDMSMNLERTDFNLGVVVSEAIDDYRRQIKQSNISTKLIYELGPHHEEHDESDNGNGQKDVFVYGDKNRITQVIYNLLGNAIKFTQHGTITVLISRQQGSNGSNDIMISVKDTGIGIHPEILPRLFSVFATKSDTGTGLGLFISKGIVEAHGGNMWGENNANGKGATFSFTIPGK